MLAEESLRPHQSVAPRAVHPQKEDPHTENEGEGGAGREFHTPVQGFAEVRRYQLASRRAKPVATSEKNLINLADTDTQCANTEDEDQPARSLRAVGRAKFPSVRGAPRTRSKSPAGTVASPMAKLPSTTGRVRGCFGTGSIRVRFGHANRVVRRVSDRRGHGGVHRATREGSIVSPREAPAPRCISFSFS